MSHFPHNPKKIEMILLLYATYNATNTEEINMTTQTQEQINQNCVETNSSYDFKTTNPDCKERKLFDLVRSGGHTAIDLIAAERYDALEWYKARASYLEKRVAELEEKYEKKDEDEDEDRDDEEEEEEALAEQAFFEGKEGGVIRWKPQAEEEKEKEKDEKEDEESDTTSCYECGECLDDPSTHIFCFEKEGEEDRTLCCECGQDFHKEYKSEGWTRDDDEEEEKYTDCDRCGENKASSVVFKGGDCLNYCRECLDELEEDGQIEKGGDAANYHYKWGYADRMERGLE